MRSRRISSAVYCQSDLWRLKGARDPSPGASPGAGRQRFALAPFVSYFFSSLRREMMISTRHTMKPTAQKGPASFAVVEMLPDVARFHVYSRAEAEETPGGGIRFTALPRRLFVRDVALP